MRPTATWAFPKQLLGKAICNDLTGQILGRCFSDRIPSRGCRFDTSSQAVPAINKAHIFWGMFESAEYRFIRDYLDPNVDVVEMGSGIGVISSFVGQKLAPQRQLICVEAHPQLILLLKRNLRTNAEQVNATIVHAAVDSSADRAPVKFYCNPHYTGSQLGGVVDAAEHEILVESTSLTQVLHDHEIGPFQLVADIEGAEARIFSSEPEALANCTQMIVELHDTVIDGKPVTEDTVRQQVTEVLKFQEIDRYGSVSVFRK